VAAERIAPVDLPRLGIKTSPQAVDWQTMDATGVEAIAREVAAPLRETLAA